jgi:hypothetical protein
MEFAARSVVNVTELTSPRLHYRRPQRLEFLLTETLRASEAMPQAIRGDRREVRLGLRDFQPAQAGFAPVDAVLTARSSSDRDLQI